MGVYLLSNNIYKPPEDLNRDLFTKIPMEKLSLVGQQVVWWRETHSHSRERHRPTQERLRLGLTDEECAYLNHLNYGKVDFLCKVGDELHKRYHGSDQR